MYRGFVASGVVAGQPDVGVLSQTEMFEHIRRICRVTSVPIFADADTGYGGILDVQRTMRLWEEAGASVLHLEDQALPKKCGHYAGKQLVSKEEMVLKLRAMIEARQRSGFLYRGAHGCDRGDGYRGRHRAARSLCGSGRGRALCRCARKSSNICASSRAV